MYKNHGVKKSKDILLLHLPFLLCSSILLCLSAWLYISTPKVLKDSVDLVDIERPCNTVKEKMSKFAPGSPPYMLHGYQAVRNAILSVEKDACEDIKQFGGAHWKSKMIYSPDVEVDVTSGNYSLCLDYGVRPNLLRCNVYSFGLFEITFESEVAEYGCQVIGFDPNLSKNEIQYSDRFAALQIGISDGSLSENQDPAKKYIRLKDILRILKESPSNIDVIKVNVEQKDVPILTELVSSGIINHVKQFLTVFNKNDESTIEQFYAQLWVLENMGFVKFAASEWAHPSCLIVDKVTGEKQVHCYKVSMYNKQFYNKYFD
ncbi:probable methyltransferase-like protein 24 [Artemia franciscana]